MNDETSAKKLAGFYFLTKRPKYKENWTKKIPFGGEKLVKVSSSIFWAWNFTVFCHMLATFVGQSSLTKSMNFSMITSYKLLCFPVHQIICQNVTKLDLQLKLRMCSMYFKFNRAISSVNDA